MNALFLIIAGMCAIGELIVTFKFFYKDHSEYVEAWKFNLRPNIWSLFKGEYIDDISAEFKLGIYHAGGIINGVCVYFGLKGIFG